MAKPNASFFGFGNNELGFCHIPDFDYKLETPDPAPTALIKITGGKLSAEAVQTELARSITMDWVWEALPHSEDSFLVVFPSVEDLHRMADVKFTLKNHGVTLTIAEWKEASDAEPSYHLDEVWVHVKGVPHAWRHYLGFWALGSVIGVTLDVDMHTYRKMGVIRLLIGTMSRDPLPLTTDIVFRNKGYEITFAVEDKNFIPATPVFFMDDPSREDKGGKETEPGQEDRTPEHTSKKQKKDEKEGGSESHTVADRDGEDTLMLGAAALSVTGTAKNTLPSVLSDFSMLHKIALTPMCSHRLARTREDLKLQKLGHPFGAELPSDVPKGSDARTADVHQVSADVAVASDGLKSTPENFPSARPGLSKMGIASAASSLAAQTVNNKGGGCSQPTASNVCLGQETVMEAKAGQVATDVCSETSTLYSKEKGRRTVARENIAVTVAFSKDKESQGVESAGQVTGKMHNVSKQGQKPTSLEMHSTGADEDLTWKAMKRTSRRNLDGDL